MAKLNCPHCTSQITIDPAQAGQAFACPHCGRAIKLRPASTAARPPLPPNAPTSLEPPASVPAGGASPFSIAINPAPRMAPVAPASPAGGSGLVAPLAIGGGLLLLCLVAIGVFLLFTWEMTPSQTLTDLSARVRQGDYGAAYDAMDRQSKADLDRVAVQIRALGQQFGNASVKEDLKNAKTNRDVFVAMMKSDPKLRVGFEGPTILSEERDGDTAKVKVRTPNGQTPTLHFVREDGLWKLTLKLGP